MEVAMTAIQQVSNHSLIASDRIEGTLVRRHNGEKIGRIERLMIDKASGTIAYENRKIAANDKPKSTAVIAKAS
jgi:hypothetical protein